MKYYPIYLDLKKRLVLLVGAGPVALQKIDGLLASGARVRVAAPEAAPEIERLAAQGRIEWRRREYATADLEGVRLVIAATDDPALQRRIASEARELNLWVNVVDVPPLCDFIAPAVVRQGDVQIAVSTGGAAPALAKFIRKKLEPMIGPEYAELVRIVEPLRGAILKLPKERRQALWERVASQPFLDQIKNEGVEKAEARLKEWINGKRAL